MIRIIKQGKEVRFTKTCPRCECEFEYELEDLQVDSSMMLTSMPPKYRTFIKCPCCGEIIYHGYTDEVHPFQTWEYINTKSEDRTLPERIDELDKLFETQE